MALTEAQELEQRQADRDALAARENARNEVEIAQRALDRADRDKHEKQNRRMELLRIARDQLEATAQSKPVSERTVTAEQIVAYAETMKAFIHAD